MSFIKPSQMWREAFRYVAVKIKMRKQGRWQLWELCEGDATEQHRGGHGTKRRERGQHGVRKRGRGAEKGRDAAEARGGKRDGREEKQETGGCETEGGMEMARRKRDTRWGMGDRIQHRNGSSPEMAGMATSKTFKNDENDGKRKSTEEEGGRRRNGGHECGRRCGMGTIHVCSRREYM